jgi:hypothetical protein
LAWPFQGPKQQDLELSRTTKYPLVSCGTTQDLTYNICPIVDMASLKHIFCIEAIVEKHPGKSPQLGGTPRFPNGREDVGRLIVGKKCKTM